MFKFCFSISELSPEQRKMSDAIIVFKIKEKFLFSSNQCIAEAFLPFADIPEFSPDEKGVIEQTHLTLTRHQKDGKVLLTILKAFC